MWVSVGQCDSCWVNSMKLKGWRRPVLVTFVVSMLLAWSVKPHVVSHHACFLHEAFPTELWLEVCCADVSAD